MPDHQERRVSNRCYDSLVNGRWNVALALADRSVELSEPESRGAMIGRVNRWLAKLGMGVDVEPEVRVVERECPWCCVPNR